MPAVRVLSSTDARFCFGRLSNPWSVAANVVLIVDRITMTPFSAIMNCSSPSEWVSRATPQVTATRMRTSGIRRARLPTRSSPARLRSRAISFTKTGSGPERRQRAGQHTEGGGDRQAADAVIARITWQIQGHRNVIAQVNICVASVVATLRTTRVLPEPVPITGALPFSRAAGRHERRSTAMASSWSTYRPRPSI